MMNIIEKAFKRYGYVRTYNYGTGKYEYESILWLLIKQKLMGLALIAVGILAAVMDPQEGGAMTILCIFFALPCLLSRKPNVIRFER